MKVYEVVDPEAYDYDYNPHNMSYLGYQLQQEEEREDDNRKIFHHIRAPGEKSYHMIDHSPYQWIGPGTFHQYVWFHKENGRFPTRRDVNSNGPLYAEDVGKLSR